MAMQGQEPGRDGGPPRRQRKRRSLRDCDVYMRTGVCVLGMTCLFNHPPEHQQQQLILWKVIVQQDLSYTDDDFEEIFPQIIQGFLAGIRRIDNLSAGAIHSPNSGPSSSAKDFPAIDVAQRGHYSRLGPSSELESVVDALLPGNKVSMEQEELSTPSNPSVYFSAEDIHSHDAEPSCILDPSSSSSAKYFSAADIVQRGSLDLSSELESVIEDSKVHWSEKHSTNDSDGNGESNRKIFESLRQQPKYQRWLNCDVAPGDISLGPKIAEGGQADIFEAKVSSRLVGFSGSVLKVFKVILYKI